jgi:hypothetical protein
VAVAFAARDAERVSALVPYGGYARGRPRRDPIRGGARSVVVIPDARFVPLDSGNQVLQAGEPAWPVFVGEMRAFLGGSSSEAEPIAASHPFPYPTDRDPTDRDPTDRDPTDRDPTNRDPTNRDPTNRDLTDRGAARQRCSELASSGPHGARRSRPPATRRARAVTAAAR